MTGAMTPDQTIRDAALAWAMATHEPAFADWDGFTAWLEADPAHARAYDAVQAALDEAAALACAPAPERFTANDNPPGGRSGWLTSRRAWLGGAVAAAMVLAATFNLGVGPRGATLHTTAPGETRVVALGDGSTVELSGGSRLATAGPRAARLESGQALFTIRHDASEPFVLTAGTTRLIDAGTVFDVRLAGARIDVAVAQGAVIVDPEAQALRVNAGMRAAGEGGRFRLAPVDVQAVGEWRRGRISFDNASLAEIAGDLTRATGTRFDSADASTRLSGSIALDAVRSDPRALGALLGVTVRAEGGGWVIAAR